MKPYLIPVLLLLMASTVFAELAWQIGAQAQLRDVEQYVHHCG